MIKAMVTETTIFHTGTNPCYGEEVTRVKLDDEAGGGFFIVSQHSTPGRGEVWLELEEIAAIYNHASKMMQDYDAETDKV